MEDNRKIYTIECRSGECDDPWPLENSCDFVTTDTNKAFKQMDLYEKFCQNNICGKNTNYMYEYSLYEWEDGGGCELLQECDNYSEE